MAPPVRETLMELAMQLSDMATAVRHLTEPDAAIPAPSTLPVPVPELDRLAERLLRQRHARARFLPPSLFHEPAWEILLSLFVAQRRGRTVNVKHLVEEVDAPVTTSQRWIDTLAHMKLIHRLADPNDRRRIELSLSDAAVSALEDYLTWLVEEEAAPGG